MHMTQTPPPPTARPSSPMAPLQRAKYALSGAILGGFVAIPITNELIRDDPSSTAALAFLVTIPLAVIVGLVIGLAVSLVVERRS